MNPLLLARWHTERGWWSAGGEDIGITESQNGGDWKGPLWVTQPNNPCRDAGRRQSACSSDGTEPGAERGSAGICGVRRFLGRRVRFGGLGS